MRSSRSATKTRLADPLDPGPRGYAHRGRHGPPPFVENSFVAFAAALEMGAGIECDVRLTGDGDLVVFHDSDAMRLCGDPAVIAETSLSQLQRLDVGGHAMPTLAQLLALVAGRTPLLIEAKPDPRRGDYARTLARAMQGYAGPLGLMSFDPWLVGWLRHEAPGARCGLVIADRLSPLKRWWAMRVAKPHFLSVETTAVGKPWVAKARQQFPVYSWTVKSAADRARCAPLADSLIWEGNGRP